jgi:hypothetical protein
MPGPIVFATPSAGASSSRAFAESSR